MTLITIITGFLTVFFLFASSIKILGWQKFILETQLKMFIKYGLNRRLMALVGVIEFFGAVAIWFSGSWTGLLGALALLGTSVGAIGCHLLWDSWKDGIPAFITGVLSAILVWSWRQPLFDILAPLS